MSSNRNYGRGYRRASLNYYPANYSSWRGNNYSDGNYWDGRYWRSRYPRYGYPTYNRSYNWWDINRNGIPDWQEYGYYPRSNYRIEYFDRTNPTHPTQGAFGDHDRDGTPNLYDPNHAQSIYNDHNQNGVPNWNDPAYRTTFNQNVNTLPRYQYPANTTLLQPNQTTNTTVVRPPPGPRYWMNPVQPTTTTTTGTTTTGQPTGTTVVYAAPPTSYTAPTAGYTADGSLLADPSCNVNIDCLNNTSDLGSCTSCVTGRGASTNCANAICDIRF